MLQMGMRLFYTRPVSTSDRLFIVGVQTKKTAVYFRHTDGRLAVGAVFRVEHFLVRYEIRRGRRGGGGR